MGLAVETGVGGAGQIYNRALVDENGAVSLFHGDTKKCTLALSVLKSMKKVSDEYQLYQSRIMFQLPWVELRGGAEWEFH